MTTLCHRSFNFDKYLYEEYLNASKRTNINSMSLIVPYNPMNDISLGLRGRNILTVTASFSLALFSLTLISTADSTYHANFYSHFSPYAWVFLSVLIISALLLILFGRSASPLRDWRSGVVLLFSGYAVLWEAPHLLNLRLWAPPLGDLLQHHGITKYIIETGSVYTDTIYPLLHILLAILSQITEVKPSGVGSAFTLITTLMFALSLAVLGGRFSSRLDVHTRRFILAVAATLVFGKLHHHIFPWFTSFQLIPLALFLLDMNWNQTRNRRAIQISVLLITVSITLYHPMTALVLLGVYLLYIVSRGAFEARSKADLTKLYSRVLSASWVLTIPLIHFIWYMDNDIMTRFLTTMSRALLGLQNSQGANRAARAAESGYTTVQLIWRFIILNYGPLLLFTGIGGAISILIVYRMSKKQSSYEEAVLASLFYGGLGLAITMLVGDFIANGPVRINQLTLLSSLLLFGIGYGIVRHSTPGTARRAATLGLIAAVLLVGAYAPITVYDEDRHVTENEFEGVDWTIEYRTLDRDVRANAMTHKQTVYLTGAQSEVKYFNWAFETSDSLPPHYGYKQNASAGETFSNDPYLVTKTRDYEWWTLEPENRKPHISYQTREDRARLTNDYTVNSIYSNGRFTVWRIYSINNSNTSS